MPQRKPLSPRAELNVRAGTERSILMNEFWVPVVQDPLAGNVLYGDLRLMGDDQDNQEFNIGVGYRQMVGGVPVLGEGIVGINGWFDRRYTDFGSRFNQITAGAEWTGTLLDLKLNGYMPLNKDKRFSRANPNPSNGFVGNQIVVSTDQSVVEESMKGLDFEVGFNVLDVATNFTDRDTGIDSARVYAGGYHFAGDKAEDISGWRIRAAADVTPDIQLGARFQRDDVRGSQSFLEATIRFPFGNKGSARRQGLYGRLDESPERDIDIVASQAVTDPGGNVALVNTTTGQAQNVIHVDNTSGGGDGTAESPFNTLAAAQAAAGPNDIIYLHRGDGTTAGQNAGITLNKTGQMLIGSGTNLVYDGSRFATANGAPVSMATLIAGTSAPSITNVGANGVTVAADNIYLAGFTVSGAQNGIVVDANGLSAQNVTITDVSAINNDRMGIYLHGYNNGSLSTMVQRSVTGGNGWHGMAVYDDTANTFDVDLGGGAMGSQGRNVLTNNTLEDLALDYDGRALSAQNNWWGQATGPDQDNPGVGIRPQIYYGAPMNDGLVGHWTFDTEWTSNTTAYDRSLEHNDGTLSGGLSLADQEQGNNGQALRFNGTSDYIDVPAESLYAQSNASFSVVASFNPGVIGGTIIHSWSPSNGWSTGLLGYKSGRLNFFIFSGASQLSPNVPQAGEWQHAVGTRNGATNANVLYENGAQAIAWNAPYSTSNQQNKLNIGYYRDDCCDMDAPRFFQGTIDDVRYYNRPLTATEVAELHRMDTSSSVSFTGFLSSAP